MALQERWKTKRKNVNVTFFITIKHAKIKENNIKFTFHLGSFVC